jgi:hypothetical protein
MEINFELVRDSVGVKNACEELAREPVLGLDTETTELDPYKGEMRLRSAKLGTKDVRFRYAAVPFERRFAGKRGSCSVTRPS